MHPATSSSPFWLRRWWLICLTVVVALMLAALFTASRTPQYQASTKLYVGIDSVKTTSDLVAGSNLVQEAVKSYADVAGTPYVLKPVIASLNLDTTPTALANRIAVSPVADESVIEVSATDPSPRHAMAIADAVSARIAVAVDALSPSGSAAAIRITQVQPAVSAGPVSPSLPVNLVLGGIVGAALGLGFAALRERLDTRIRSVAAVQELVGHAVLRTISRSAADRLVDFNSNAWDASAEAFRTLRTSLEYREGGEPGGRVWTVLSAGRRNGGTVVALNIAQAFASLQERVLVIDGDLRRPQVADTLQIDGEVGLSDVLRGQVTFDAAAQQLTDGHLTVLPAGGLVGNPSELLHGSRMKELIQSARQQFRYIIIDVPPLAAVTDAAVIATASDSVISVVALDVTRASDAISMVHKLAEVGVRMIGTVVTTTSSREAGDRRGARYGVDPVRAATQQLSR